MSSSQILDTFHLFPLLPPELRLLIWHESCTPRVITLTYLSAPADTFVTTHTRPPALLHVCAESRAYGLARLYVKCPILPSPAADTTLTTHGGHETREEEEIYFHLHPTLDTLYLPRPPSLSPSSPSPSPFPSLSHSISSLGYATHWTTSFFTSRVPSAAGTVHKLALDYVPASVRRPWEVYGKVSLLRGCGGGLEEAVLVVKEEESPQGEGGGSHGGEEDGEVELVDFAEDRAGFVRAIVERVKESFWYELQSAWTSGLEMGREERKGGRGNGEGWELELVPKARVMRGCGRRPLLAGCVG